MVTIFTRLFPLLLSTTLPIPVAAQAEKAEAPEVKRTAKQFLQAFVHPDLDKMSEYLAERVLFDGDRRFIRRVKLNQPAELRKQELLDAYGRLFDYAGKDRWHELSEKVKPTLVKATADGEPLELARKGDYVYDLHWREAIKGKRNGLDEAVIFLFRKVGDEYRVVAHFADY